MSNTEPEPDHVARLRRIVDDAQSAAVPCPVTGKPLLVDLYSASAFMSVWDRLHPDNRASLATYPLEDAVRIAMKVLG